VSALLGFNELGIDAILIYLSKYSKQS